MNRSIRYLLATLALALGIAIPAAAAYAGEDENHHRGAAAGAACTPRWNVGDTATIDTPNGPQKYRCEQRKGDPCPVWHWVFDPNVPKGQGTPNRCPECPSSPPPPSSAPPSAPSSSSPPLPSTSSAPPSVPPSVPPSASATPSPGGQLPVTGVRPWHIAGLALLIIFAGVGLVLGARRRRTS